MKPMYRTAGVVAGLTLSLALLLTGFSPSFAQGSKTLKDTVPQKKEKKITDLDEAIEELDRSMMQLEKEMKNQDWKKMDAEVKAAMKEIDVTKINAEVQKALKEIDVERIKVDVQKSLKEIDVTKLKADVEASIAAIDVEKIKVDMEKLKTIDMKALQAEMEKIKPQIEASMKGAKESLEKAKAELQEYKGFIDGLENDGLIKKNEPYKIEHKDSSLIINGKTQPESVSTKYRIFLQKHTSFTIKKDSDDLNIDMD